MRTRLKLKVRDAVRDIVNQRGWDVRPYRPFWDLVPRLGFDLVLDAGANRGQFGSSMRRLGYRGPMLSFEPQPGPFAELAALTASDPNWEAMQVALGAREETLSLRVYEADVFSSFLALRGEGPKQVGTVEVPVKRLDDVAADRIARAHSPLLKVDVQGFEREVLEGASGALDAIKGLVLELSLVPHYEGQWVLEDALRTCREAGFVPYTMRRGYFEGDQDVEYDVLFVRESVMQTIRA